MPLKLFVADDSVTIQKIVSLAFSGEDVVIQAVSDGNAALEALESCKPDIVLADVFMPGCNGYEVCARIKDDPALSHIPVILLVGTFEPFDQAEAARVKYDASLTKPFDTSELVETVHALTAKNEAAQAEQIAAETAAPAEKDPVPNFPRGLVSPAVWESFVGEKRILEIFDPENPIYEAGKSTKSVETPAPEMRLSEDSLNLIVEKVVRKMSPDVIREVAWEVVPELSESIIREKAKEQQ